MTVLARARSEPVAARPPGAVGAAAGLLGILGLLAYPAPVAWLGLGALLVLGAVRWWRGSRGLPGGPFAVPIALYLAGAAIGLYAAVRPEMAEARFFGLLAGIGALLLVVEAARSPRAARWLIAGLVVALLAGSLVLLVVIAPLLRLDRLPGRLDWLAGPLAGLIAASEPFRGLVLDVDSIGQRYRLSTAGLGILAAYGLGLSLGPLLAGPDRRTRLLGGLAAATFAGLMILPGNRSAVLIAALLPIGLLALRHRRVLAVAVVAGLGASLLLALALQATNTRGEWTVAFLPQNATDPGPLHERLELWRNYLFLLEDFRFTGVGLGLRTVAAVYQRRFAPVDPGFNHAHNMFLQSYLEQGIPGLLGIVGLVAVGLVVAARALRRARAPIARQAAVSGSAAALVLIIDGLTEIVPLTTVGMVLLFAALGLTFAALRLEREEQASEAPAEAEPPGHPRDFGAPVPASARLGLLCFLGLLVLAAGVGLSPSIARAGSAAGVPGSWAAPANPLAALGAQLFVNLGAVELNKATLDDQPERGGPRRHQATAESLLYRALELDPTSPGAYRNLAQLAVARSQPEEARRALSRARGLAAEQDDLFHFQVARLYRETGSVDLAIAAWARVDRTHGAWSCSQPYMQLIRWGAELLGAYRFESAERVARAAIKTQPAEPHPYRLLRAALGAEGDQAAVARAMEELIRAQPDIPWPYVELQQLHARAGRTGEAEAWRQRAAAVRRSERWQEVQRRFLDVRDCKAYLPAVLAADG